MPKQGESLLDAALANSLDAPYACKAEPVRRRVALAGQDVALAHLVIFQRVVRDHLGLALQHLGAPRATEACRPQGSVPVDSRPGLQVRIRASRIALRHKATGLDWPTTIGSFAGVVYGQVKNPSRVEK
jgi:hypothetical protein